MPDDVSAQCGDAQPAARIGFSSMHLHHCKAPDPYQMAFFAPKHVKLNGVHDKAAAWKMMQCDSRFVISARSLPVGAYLSHDAQCQINSSRIISHS